VSETVVIPKSIDQAIPHLGGIDKLVTAKQWERAAIVFAFTYIGADRYGLDGHYTIAGFAKLGIAGITAPETVRRYRRAWELGGGDQKILPGSSVNLPKLAFPSYEECLRGGRPDARPNGKKPWRERIVNQAQIAYQRASKDPLTTREVEALEEAARLFSAAVAAVIRRRELGNLDEKLPGYSKYAAHLEQSEDWLTAEDLAAQFNKTPASILRALYRLKKGGMVVNRSKPGGGGLEWSAPTTAAPDQDKGVWLAEMRRGLREALELANERDQQNVDAQSIGGPRPKPSAIFS